MITIHNLPEVTEDDHNRFHKGIHNGFIIVVVFFWAPLIFLIAWLINR
jgi:hypothetical protein